MKSLKKIGILALIAATLLLAGGGLGVYWLYNKEILKNKELEAQLAELTKEEQRSVVMQQVNAQMEEIANEERRISDEQREAAEQQAKIAQQERQNAENERREADLERQNALLAEHKAVEASQIAQNQRKIAEQQRYEAEHSKRVTDTLSYITLGRTLGNLATNQLQAGNIELAEMLGYTAYLYTERYKGFVYIPAVYQALVATSQSKRSWNRHKGMVTSVEFFPKDNNRFVTVSTYGEVMIHEAKGENISSKMLFSNNQFDFRDVVLRSNGEMYVTSRNGQIIVLSLDGKQTILTMPENEKMIGLTPIGNQLMAAGRNTLYIIDPEHRTIAKTQKVPFNIVFGSRYDYSPAVFDDKGQMHIVRALNRLETNKLPFSGQVTAFASSKNEGLKAYGMLDGTIYLERPNGQITKLVGHRSKVTKLKINGVRIYSSSYDGSLIQWMADQEKIEPMPLFTTNGWLMNFTFNSNKQSIWAGDQKGNITEAYISVPLMVEKLKNKLTRNFTPEEWNYYVGKNVPYEKIK